MGGEVLPCSVTPVTALSPGFRFHPTDEELVRYYLTRKVCGKGFRIDAIAEADIYKMEPWDLPGLSRLQSRDLEWYFFSALDKKYGNGARMNRATAKGYWKATGNDRAVKHESRTIGMKKTLVFHKGRAPGGKRTNWVMHEYRLVDEELERSGVIKDGFVLCRVFQKSGLGPPNGDQYAPFIEDEWDDDQITLIPGTEVVREAVVEAHEGDDGDGTCLSGHEGQQTMQQEKAPLQHREHDVHGLSFVKNERLDDWPLPSIVRNKRPRLIGPKPCVSNGSKNPSTTTPDLMATEAVATEEVATTAARTLLEIPLLESIERRVSPEHNESLEPKESVQVPSPRRFDIETFGMSVHPSYLELINKLQKEIHNISCERETFKIELMSAQTLINIMQSKMDSLIKENEELRKNA